MIKSMSNLFSKDEINTGRQLEFDILKALAIIFMITIHVFLYFPVIVDDTTFFLIDGVFGGVLAAPVFMFAMGLGWAYTRHNTAHDFIKRGAYLLILSFVLNFLRGIILFTGVLINPDAMIHLLTIPESFLLSFIDEWIYPDILQFAGLAFILWGLFKKFNVGRKLIIIFTLICSILSLVFYSIPVNNLIVYDIAGYFINTTYLNNISCFPLFSWFIFPVAGYEFAMLLKRCKDKNKFYLKIIPLSIIAIIVFFILDILTGEGVYSAISFYHISIFGALHCIAIALTCLGIYHFLIPYLPNKVISLAKLLSVHITEIYVFSWLLIYCFMVISICIIGVEACSTIVSFLLVFLIITLSLLISMAYRKSELKSKIKIL